MIEICRYQGRVIGFRIAGRPFLWDALTARAIRLGKRHG